MSGDRASPALAICGTILIILGTVTASCWLIWAAGRLAARLTRPAPVTPPPLPVDGEPLDDGERADLAGIERDLDPEPAPAAGTAWWPFWRTDGGPR